MADFEKATKPAPPARLPPPPTPTAPAPASAPTKASPPGGNGLAAAIALEPPKPIDLQGRAALPITPALAAYVAQGGRHGADVPVTFGNISKAGGLVRIVSDDGTSFHTAERVPGAPLAIPIDHAFLHGPLADLKPHLRIKISDNAITGWAAPGNALNAPDRINKTLRGATEALGLAGFKLPDLALQNEIAGGVFRLGTSKDITATLAGWITVQLGFAIENDAVTFAGHGTVNVRGLGTGELSIKGDAKAVTGSAEMSIALHKFSGKATATYASGNVDITGTATYTTDKLKGSLTIVVMEAAKAEKAARDQIDPEHLATESTTHAEAGDKPEKLKAGERGIAGWGELDFALTDWFTGKAKAIVGPSGYVTVIGKIAPPKTIELLEERPYNQLLFAVHPTARYGLPYVADVHVGIDVELGASARIGPAVLTNIAVEGTYSTDPTISNSFSLTGSFRISAYAGLNLRFAGKAGLTLLGHDINFGAAITGTAGIKGYAEATPTLGYRETDDPAAGKKGECYLKGHLEIAAQPFVGLAGELFVELDSPWWSPAPDKTWTWPLFSMEYPLPGEFGIAADIDYVVGSKEWPKIDFGSAAFDASKFTDSLLDRQIPDKKVGGDVQKQGAWKGEPPAAPVAPPAPVPKTARPPAAAKPTAGTPAPTAGKGGQAPEEARNVPKTPDSARRFTEGMKALGALHERAENDPETDAEIHTHLAAIKQKFGFTRLEPALQGNYWIIDAELNPSARGGSRRTQSATARAAPTSSPTSSTAPSSGGGARRLQPLIDALAPDAAKTHPSRHALEMLCRRRGEKLNAIVNITGPLQTGTSHVTFTERTPPAGQSPEHYVVTIVDVGVSDDAIIARLGSDVGRLPRDSSEPPKVLANLGQGSMAANPGFEQEAKEFERKLGTLAWNHAAAKAGARDLSAKVKAYLRARTGPWDAANRELTDLCNKIGSDSVGRTGVVGTEIQDVMDVFDSGNIAEQMTHVYAFFFEILAHDLVNVNARDLQKHLSDAKYAADQLMARRTEMQDQQRARGGTFSKWDIAPTAPRSQVELQRGTRAKRGDVMGLAEDDTAGRSAVARGNRTIEQVGTELSERERALHMRPEPDSDPPARLWNPATDLLKWEQGTRVWVMNERDRWVQWQRKLSLPIGGGPSGTANALMQAANALACEAIPTRAACIAYLLPPRHHTLVEVLAAAEPFGCKYHPGQRMYRWIIPLTTAELKSCGIDGRFPDESLEKSNVDSGPVQLVLPDRRGAP